MLSLSHDSDGVRSAKGPGPCLAGGSASGIEVSCITPSIVKTMRIIFFPWLLIGAVVEKIANLGLQTLRFAILPFLTLTSQNWVSKHYPLANYTFRCISPLL
jgi:hypothetical protein